MKVWQGYGSEHSMNLVMIGKFENVQEASEAKRLIDQLVSLAVEDDKSGQVTVGDPKRRFSPKMLDYLAKTNFLTISPGELEQFTYDVKVEHIETTVEVSTDESDVSAFLKALLHHNARVEVFSAHYHDKDIP